MGAREHAVFQPHGLIDSTDIPQIILFITQVLFSLKLVSIFIPLTVKQDGTLFFPVTPSNADKSNKSSISREIPFLHTKQIRRLRNT